VKSLSETHPDFGFASAAEDVHLKVEGSAHKPPVVGVAVGEGQTVGVEVRVVMAALSDFMPTHAATRTTTIVKPNNKPFIVIFDCAAREFFRSLFLV
jgi:hypothetical protein